MSKEGSSTISDILQATIDGEAYTGTPQTVIGQLLLELKEVIESGPVRAETQIQGWKSITPGVFAELDVDGLMGNYHRYTLLVYIRKGQNRQTAKFELTKEELTKVINKVTTNAVVISRVACGVSNANTTALLKQTVQRETQESTGIGTINIKYNFYEGGTEVSAFDNFEFCIYAE